MEKPAYLPQQYTRHPVIGQVYPGVIQREEMNNVPMAWRDIQQSCVEGILLTDISPSEVEILDWYEDTDYTRSNVPISLHDGRNMLTVEAQVYIWIAGDNLLELESCWSFEKFCQKNLEWYLKATVDPCRKEIDRIEPDL